MRKGSLLIVATVALAIGLSSCYGESEYGKAEKSPAVGVALMSPTDSPNKDAAKKNDEGVLHLKQEHWDTAADYFREVIQMDANLAEAHFNLGLSLDEMGKHQEASEHFKMAVALAPENPKIAENEILKKHL